MKKRKFEYSTNNIPLSSGRCYKLQFIEKTEIVIERMRWKAIFENKKKEKNNHQSYGLCSFKITTSVKELATFESELIELVKNIKFQKVKETATKSIERRHKKINQICQIRPEPLQINHPTCID